MWTNDLRACPGFLQGMFAACCGSEHPGGSRGRRAKTSFCLRQRDIPPSYFLPYTACLVSVTRKAVQPGQRLRCPHVYRTDCPRANSGLGDRDERKTSLYSNCICDMRVYWNCSSRLRGCSVSSGDAFGRRGCCWGGVLGTDYMMAVGGVLGQTTRWMPPHGAGAAAGTGPASCAIPFSAP